MTRAFGATALALGAAACGSGATGSRWVSFPIPRGTTTYGGATGAGPIKSATAITEVFGNGMRIVAVAVEYDKDIDDTKLARSAFTVRGRTVVEVRANTSAATAQKGRNGKYVIVTLSPDDSGTSLHYSSGLSGGVKTAKASVTQTETVTTTDDTTYSPTGTAVATSKVINPIVDDFNQFAYKDTTTGDTLQYNLFVPRDYDAGTAYPLVVFMHDAAATSTDVLTTLVQGLGAVCWASPEDQTRHPCLVLAPQYAGLVAGDNYQATSMRDTTVSLIRSLAGQYSIDMDRLYATGQGGGGMLAIAMNIAYPNLFAASYLVACRWDPAEVAPLARDRLWIVVSQGDGSAYPGMSVITGVLERGGAKVSRAVWNGRSTAQQFDVHVDRMVAEAASINYAVLERGTVVPEWQADTSLNNHLGTWAIAYAIPGIREWIFAQRR
ncbi:PHB depolymerase family esterase [Thermoactinospora rubra]|uniref:PHB depolymerase family esterase n=1 Tax=Thermoactinospora rubra TaxID=1088767 RepID=UPI00197EDBF2|nr:PHB depolymerase family esterase [Thermoactinospora rubra]